MSQPSYRCSTSLQIGASTRNRTLFTGVQSRCIASNALEAWQPTQESNLAWRIWSPRSHRWAELKLAAGVGFEPTLPWFRARCLTGLGHPATFGACTGNRTLFFSLEGCSIASNASHAKIGAQGRSRTYTPFRATASEAAMSTSSITQAWGDSGNRTLDRRVTTACSTTELESPLVELQGIEPCSERCKPSSAPMTSPVTGTPGRIRTRIRGVEARCSGL